MLCREPKVGYRARAVTIRSLARLRNAVEIRARERLPFVLRVGDRLGRRDALHGHLHVGLLLERGRIHHVAELVIPAALLGGTRPHLGDRAPHPQRPIGDDTCGGPQTALRQVTQDLRPDFRRFAMPALDGAHHLGPVGQPRDQHQQGGLVRLEPGLYIDPIGPDVDRLKRRQIARLPPGLIALPLVGQPLHATRA